MRTRRAAGASVGRATTPRVKAKRKLPGRGRRAQASTTDGKRLLTCKKFHVIRRYVLGADGKRHAREVVVHPGAAVVLPVLDDGRIVLIDQLRHTINRRLLELPAGTLDIAKEPPAKCAARELEEETGYVARSIRPLCTLYPSPGIMTELIHAFVATGLTMTTARPEATEDIVLREMDLNDAIAAVLDGTIVDAKTMITLMHYRLQRERFA